jgi:hypothetical protein
MSRNVMSKVVLFNVDAVTASAAHPMGPPQAAKPGDCFARAVVLAQYDAVTEH